MDFMDLFYKKEGKDMYVEKVFSLVKDIIGVNYFDFGKVGVVRKDQLRVLPGMFSQAIECIL